MTLTKIENGKRVWLDVQIKDDKAIHLALVNELGFECEEDEDGNLEFYRFFDGGGIGVSKNYGRWTIIHRHTEVKLKSRHTLFDQIREVWEIEAEDRENAKGRVW